MKTMKTMVLTAVAVAVLMVRMVLLTAVVVVCGGGWMWCSRCCGR